MKNSWQIIVFMLLGLLSVNAQDISEKKLSKQQAISIALESNYGIRIAKNNEAIASNNKDLLNSGFLPSLTANASGNIDETDTETDFDGALRDDGTPREPIEILDAVTQRYDASLNLNYTLFDGLGRYYNFKRLKEQYNLSNLQSREVIENTFLQLFSVYYEVARLEENVSILQQTLNISEERKLRAQYQFDYGQVSKLQVLNAEVNTTTDKVNLLNTQQQLKNTQRDLNVILNENLDRLFVVDTVVSFTNSLQMEKFVETANANNVNLQQIEIQNTINNYQVKQAESFLLPTINLSGSYGWNRVNNPASAFFPGNIRSDVSLAVGASLTWNLFDGGSSITTLKNAKLQKQNIDFEAQQIKQQVFRDIKNAKETYANALQIFELQKNNVVTATHNFERSKEQLKRGQITSIEFRQAQLNLSNAQTTKSSAKYTAKLSELRLLQLTGQLLNVDF